MIDPRLFVILGPIIGGGSWALFTISRLLLQQISSLSKNNNNFKTKKTKQKK